MIRATLRSYSLPLLGLLVLVAAAACSGLPRTVVPTATALPPSATPEPLAAEVNGERITLAEYEREVARYEIGQSSLGIDLATTTEYRKTVLRAMIEERVVVQAALAEGLTVEDSALAQGVDRARAARGGDPQFTAWLTEMGYSVDEFSLALKRQMLSRLITDQVAGTVASKAEQVHAAHIMVATHSVADEVLLNIASGADFAEMARVYSQDLSTQAGGGDLGWFPRGVLAVPEVEVAAFALQPGEVSTVISATDGFHIVQTRERESERQLSAAALETLRRNAIRRWIDEHVAAAELQVLVALP